MSLTFTVSYAAHGTPNFQALETLESGRLRDINGNSYDTDELRQAAADEGAFTVDVVESDVEGWTVGEVREHLQDEASALTLLYLTTDLSETTSANGVEIALPQEPERASFVDGPDSGGLYILSHDGITATVSSEQDDSTVIELEDADTDA